MNAAVGRDTEVWSSDRERAYVSLVAGCGQIDRSGRDRAAGAADADRRVVAEAGVRPVGGQTHAAGRTPALSVPTASRRRSVKANANGSGADIEEIVVRSSPALSVA